MKAISFVWYTREFGHFVGHHRCASAQGGFRCTRPADDAPLACQQAGAPPPACSPPNAKVRRARQSLWPLQRSNSARSSSTCRGEGVEAMERPAGWDGRERRHGTGGARQPDMSCGSGHCRPCRCDSSAVRALLDARRPGRKCGADGASTEKHSISSTAAAAAGAPALR